LRECAKFAKRIASRIVGRRPASPTP
jgi:hypothetical protein